MFSHPVSGITHTLTVQEIEQQTVPQNSFGSDRWIYPTHYIAMSYTLTPEPMENISVFDCDEGDRPIEVTPDDHSFRPVGSSSCFVVGVIGGADGPTAIFLTSKLAPELLGPIAIAAYSYMALIPMIQPPLMKLLTTEKERQVKMEQNRQVSKTEKIIFPIVVSLFVILLLPSTAPLIGCLMLGNLWRECGVTARLSDTVQNALMNIVTVFLGISVGATTVASSFLSLQTLYIVGLGLLAFCFSTIGGLLVGKLMYKLSGGKINPLIGSAGVSAVPMAARVSQIEGQKANPSNFLLMHAMGPNVAGVIGSAIAAGFLLAVFG